MANSNAECYNYFMKNIRSVLLNICCIGLVLGGVVLAGNIDVPSTTPIATGYTLEDIFQKVSNPAYTSSAHSLSAVVSTDNTTMHSLSDIYAAIPARKTLLNSTTTMETGIYDATTTASVDADLTPSKIKTGVTIFGVTGTYDCQ